MTEARTSDALREEADRIIYDFQQGGQLGHKSTVRLLALMRRMAGRLDELENSRGRTPTSGG